MAKQGCKMVSAEITTDQFKNAMKIAKEKHYLPSMGSFIRKLLRSEVESAGEKW